MTVVETLLVYVGVPVLGFAVLAVLVYAGGTRRGPRYRPGRGWSHEDVWYLPRPVAAVAAPAHSALALTGSTAYDARSRQTARGGASGTW